MSLLDTASLIVTPNGYKGGVTTGKLYSVKPTNGDGDMVVTRNTTSTRVNSSGFIQSVAFNAPRIDYTNASCPSILVEPQRTNNFTNSQNISGWFAPAENVTLTSNTTDTLSPDGTNNASKITIGSGSPKRSFQITNSVAGVGTFSAYVKAGTSNEITLLTTSGSINIVYNLSTLAITATNGTGTITSVGNGWYRITATNTLIAVEVLQVVYTNTAGQTIYIWGFQVEAGSTATSYIPTTTIPLVRNADSIIKTGITNLIGQTEGTLFVDVIGTKNILASNKFILQISGSKSIHIAFYASVINIVSNPIDISVGFTPNVNYKIAVVYSNAVTNNFKVYVNGVPTHTLSTYTGGTFSFLGVGQRTSGIDPLNSNINSVQLYKTALTNDQCIDLTT